MSEPDPDALFDVAVPVVAPKPVAASKPQVPAKGRQVAAPDLPVAKVWVDAPLAHLDRTFDYLVPEKLDAEVVAGCRVRVRFNRQLTDGFVAERVAESDLETSRLLFLDKVVSPEPVLSPEVAGLCRAVADRYGGTMIDVLRFAVPPRHARVEAEEPAEPAAAPAAPDPTGWARYPRGAAFLDALQAGRQAHAVWQALPGEDWPARLAEVAASAASVGRGAVIVVPDHRDVARVRAACVALAGEDAVVALSADLGPAKRYRGWLSVRRGVARIVVGTRATAYAPVVDPGVLVVWDDGDDQHSDQRSPYPHVRDVLIQRATRTGAAMLVAGIARTAEAQLLVDTGWAPEIVAARAELRAAAPRVTAIGEHDSQLARDPAARTARVPSVAFDAARAALSAGHPVLVQVPRRGYVPALTCQECRAPARCRRCAGPLGIPQSGGEARSPACRWCAATEANFRCQNCGSRRLRAAVVGAKRTAEELGRAFTGVPVRTSGAKEVLASVDAKPALVVATPGAEPVAEGGYGAALLLDGWALLGRVDLRAAEEALRRWMTAAALVRPGTDGGRVVVLADSTLAPVQALVRWDPVWHATVELAARTELGFPPAVRMASVDGSPNAVARFLADLPLPPTGEVLGPVQLGDPESVDSRERALIRVDRPHGRDLAAVLAKAQAVRTARKDPDPLRVQLDPLDLI
ncbi:primosomal protein N' [Actinokineospora terrae]|uniref:Probable replication restart protein PriA n=1 Tax=Actinokineospora terrae TaxID=155974 RepID=A0A1H9PZW0_9PSEU|nr:primosomal protein N' [Actinokineospora terrae]SER53690.1 replication restart DNA helicase PriA [Actinokineospora terrae]